MVNDLSNNRIVVVWTLRGCSALAIVTSVAAIHFYGWLVMVPMTSFGFAVSLGLLVDEIRSDRSDVNDPRSG